jgi:hypothetical protein
LEEEDKKFKLPTAAEIRKLHLQQESLANKQKELKEAEQRNKNSLEMM